MFSHEDSGRKQEPPQPPHTGATATYQTWLDSNPVYGEALVDTGLSSAADSRKLRWSLNPEERDIFGRLIAQSMERDVRLSREGDLEAEARRLTILARGALQAQGLNPIDFGFTPPEQELSD